MKYWASYGQAKHTSDVPEARKRAMPRLLGVLRGRRSWQGHVGCHRRPLEEGRARRLRFALCTAASAPFLPWRRREHTHAGFLRSHVPIYRGCLRASSTKSCASWCSSDAPYEHQPPVPIAHFGGRFHRDPQRDRRPNPGRFWGYWGREAP